MLYKVEAARRSPCPPPTLHPLDHLSSRGVREAVARKQASKQGSKEAIKQSSKEVKVESRMWQQAAAICALLLSSRTHSNRLFGRTMKPF